MSSKALEGVFCMEVAWEGDKRPGFPKGGREHHISPGRHDREERDGRQANNSGPSKQLEQF